MLSYVQEMTSRRSKSDMELMVATCWAILHVRNLLTFQNETEDSQLSAGTTDAVVHS